MHSQLKLEKMRSDLASDRIDTQILMAKLCHLFGKYNHGWVISIHTVKRSFKHVIFGVGKGEINLNLGKRS